MRIFSISLGCPKNRVDTERALAFSADVQLVASPEDADCIFINTCGFIAPAIEESVQTILEYAQYKTDISANSSTAESPLLVVAGCLVGRYGEKTLAPDLPEVDLFLDAKDPTFWHIKLAALCSHKKLQKVQEEKTEQEHKKYLQSTSLVRAATRILSTPPSYAWLKISEGCRHACSFCTIPSIRGKLISTDADILVNDAQYILSQGVKELVLVAQDVTAWGKDTNTPFMHLLDKILPLDGLQWLRLLYMYPAELDDALLSYLQQVGKPFIPYFDVPLQHASENVLCNMGRPFSKNPYAVIEKIRHYFPEAAIRTSIITGFPGETDKDFEQLLQFVEDVRFHHLGVFAYQAEEGTKAATMPNQIPETVKDLRRDLVMEAQGIISEDILEAYAGSVQEVLVDSVHDEWPGLHVGRTWFQAPEIDGHTYISGVDVFPGAMVQAEITDTDVYDISALSLAPEKI